MMAEASSREKERVHARTTARKRVRETERRKEAKTFSRASPSVSYNLFDPLTELVRDEFEQKSGKKMLFFTRL